MDFDDETGANIINALPAKAASTLMELNMGENIVGDRTVDAICDKLISVRRPALSVLDLFCLLHSHITYSMPVVYMCLLILGIDSK